MCGGGGVYVVTRISSPLQITELPKIACVDTGGGGGQVQAWHDTITTIHYLTLPPAACLASSTSRSSRQLQAAVKYCKLFSVSCHFYLPLTMNVQHVNSMSNQNSTFNTKVVTLVIVEYWMLELSCTLAIKNISLSYTPLWIYLIITIIIKNKKLIFSKNWTYLIWLHTFRDSTKESRQ